MLFLVRFEKDFIIVMFFLFFKDLSVIFLKFISFSFYPSLPFFFKREYSKVDAQLLSLSFK